MGIHPPPENHHKAKCIFSFSLGTNNKFNKIKIAKLAGKRCKVALVSDAKEFSWFQNLNIPIIKKSL